MPSDARTSAHSALGGNTLEHRYRIDLGLWVCSQLLTHSASGDDWKVLRNARLLFEFVEFAPVCVGNELYRKALSSRLRQSEHQEVALAPDTWQVVNSSVDLEKPRSAPTRTRCWSVWRTRNLQLWPACTAARGAAIARGCCVIWPRRFQAGSRESLNAGGALALGDPLRNKSAGCLNDWASRLRGKRASASASTIGVATRHTVACDHTRGFSLLLSIGRKERP
jgi:hypothetical protein